MCVGVKLMLLAARINGTGMVRSATSEPLGACSQTPAGEGVERAGGQRAQGGAAGAEPVQAPEAARHRRRRPRGHGGAAGRLQPVRKGLAKSQGLITLCAQR